MPKLPARFSGKPPLVHSSGNPHAMDFSGPLLVVQIWTLALQWWALLTALSLSLQDTIASYCGSLFWASPEQLNGQSCSSATDIWSLGVILWETCTGEQPLRRVTRPLRSAVALMVAMPFAGGVEGGFAAAWC